MLLDWYQYRAQENTGSQLKLRDLLAALDMDVQASPDYDKDIDDLESLKSSMKQASGALKAR